MTHAAVASSLTVANSKDTRKSVIARIVKSSRSRTMAFAPLRSNGERGIKNGSEHNYNHRVRDALFYDCYGCLHYDGVEKMKIVIQKYMIEPYSSSMCWNIKKYREHKNRKTGEITEDWFDTGIYPSSLEMALVRVSEWLLMDKDIEASIESAIAEIQTTRRAIEKAIGDAK